MQPKANILIELRSAMNLWQNNAKPTHPKTQDRIHGHRPCQQAQLPCYCVIYGCGYESSTQTKFTYYKL